MGIKQRAIRIIISTMGRLYVWLDKKLDHPIGPILDLKIDDDFAFMSRYELCRHVEKTFALPKDAFWELESTQKIRFCCQNLRNITIRGD